MINIMYKVICYTWMLFLVLGIILIFVGYLAT